MDTRIEWPLRFRVRDSDGSSPTWYRDPPGSGRAGVVDWADGDGSRPPRRARRVPACPTRGGAPEQVGLPAAAAGARPACVARRSRCSPACRSPGTRGSSRAAASTPRPTCCAAIGRALRLDDAGQDHLLALAQPDTVGRCRRRPTTRRRALRAPDHVDGAGAGLRARSALGVPRLERRRGPAVPAIERARRDRAQPAVGAVRRSDTRELIVDWDIHARQALAEFRAATTAVRDDPEMVELVELLSAVSDEFATWWPEHDVARFETRLRRFHHPRGRHPDVRVPAAGARRVAGAARRRPAARARRRLRRAPRRPPRRVLNAVRASRRQLVAAGRVGAAAADDDRGHGVGGLDGSGERGDVVERGAATPAPPPPRREAGRERVARADRVDDRDRRDGHGRPPPPR